MPRAMGLAPFCQLVVVLEAQPLGSGSRARGVAQHQLGFEEHFGRDERRISLAQEGLDRHLPNALAGNIKGRQCRVGEL